MANKRTRDASVSPSSEAEEEALLDRSKYAHVQPTSTEVNATPAIQCFLPPHSPYSFTTYEDFDVHYHKTHVNRCSDCDKNFPSNHFLTLHIAEVHDMLAEAKRARGDKTFGCFVEDCEKICLTPQKRRLHLIDKHHFPKTYNFFITKDGLDARHSMLVPRSAQRRLSLQIERTPDASSSAMPDSQAADMSGPEPMSSDGIVSSPEAAFAALASTRTVLGATDARDDADVESLTKGMSSLKFVPPSVRFGRGGRGRGRNRGALARK